MVLARNAVSVNINMSEPDSNSASPVKKFNYADFTDKKILGEGSFNQVYVVRHPEIGRCVVKIVSRLFYAKERMKLKLEKEAAEMFNLKHEHILPGYGIVIESAHLCLVYEHAEYGSLTDALRRISLSWPLKIRIAYQTALAMCYLHSFTPPIIHRSLKGSNILLTKEFNVKISDCCAPKTNNWNIQATHQKEITDRRRREAGEIAVKKGSMYAHIPPEVIRNINTKPSPSYDMYSFGVVLWQMMANKEAFADNTTGQVFKMLLDNNVLPIDELISGYPLVLYDVMDQAFNEPSLRPSFSEAAATLNPFYQLHAAMALKDAIECQQAYERYRVIKRDRLSSRNLDSQTDYASTSTGNSSERTFSDTSTTSKSPHVHESGQIVDTSAHVASIPPVRKNAPAALHPASMKTTTIGAQPMEDSDEETDKIPCSPPICPPEFTSSSTTPSDSSSIINNPLTPAPPPSISEPRSSSKSEEDKKEDKPSEKSCSYHSELPDQDPKAQPIPEQEDPIVRRQTANFNISAGQVNVQVGPNMRMNSDDLSGSAAPVEIPPIEISMIGARNSQRILTTDDIYIVADNVGTNWKRLARNMNLSDGQIDEINHDYDRDGLGEKVYRVVRKWEQKSGGAVTVGQLAQILISTRLRDIASKLPA
ncbi:receptor-interacting serine/threonine-protein kinase 1-like [Clavelina lepadiformis]|uniref:receptor-interacting serine/threonine-protein kinase 1-like n=1 Tax=Clavelina lepadiformis TaxID=159417 RepID=UPI0040432B5E